MIIEGDRHASSAIVVPTLAVYLFRPVRDKFHKSTNLNDADSADADVRMAARMDHLRSRQLVFSRYGQPVVLHAH